LSNDQQLEQKFWDIVGLYLSPPQQAVRAYGGLGERARLACRARRPAEHQERSTDSLFSEPSARADSVGQTPTDAAETAALPISTE